MHCTIVHVGLYSEYRYNSWYFYCFLSLIFSHVTVSFHIDILRDSHSSGLNSHCAVERRMHDNVGVGLMQKHQSALKIGKSYLCPHRTHFHNKFQENKYS